MYLSSIVGILSEFLKTLSAILNGQLAQFTWKEEFDGCFNFFGGESLLLVENEESSAFLDHVVKKFSENLIELSHCLLGDTKLWFDLLQHSVDVSLHRV